MNRMRLFELLLFILNHTCSGADARALDGVLQAHVSPSDQSSRPMVLAPLVGIVGGLFSHALRANGSAPAGMVRSVLQADPSLDCLAGLGYLLGFDWESEFSSPPSACLADLRLFVDQLRHEQAARKAAAAAAAAAAS
ncbi:unnamed protein product, partial [Closterium sp. Yama58-4]